MSAEDTTTSGPLSAGGRRLLDRFPPPLLAMGGLLLVAQAVLGVGQVLPDADPATSAAGGAETTEDGPIELTFVLTGDRRSAEVTYSATGVEMQEIEAAPLPWRRTFRISASGSASVQIQNLWRNGPGKVTCTVLIGGEVVQQQSEFGDSAIASCDNPGPGSRPIPGATVPAQGNGLLPGETRLTETVPVKRYPGTGSPVAGRVSDGDPRLSYTALGGEWGRSRTVDPLLAGYSREQRFDTEPKWQAAIASGFVDDDLMEHYTGENRLRALAGAALDYRQFMDFDETARGRDVASQPIRAGGRKGWVVVREIRHDTPDVRARLDLTAMVVVDTGRPRPSFLWICIPETHKKLWPDINTVIDSLRVD
ncbi:hypothetical protein [Thermomonospora amylolytica]|uniref:hypothetical protein n=1 Tax=Thermomonospora amylolytica TaxID=1411117 RepID=UPI000E6C85C5|nr:hypothetical protein [Thermomonospora amylolytica]